jgi:repressor LexA
MNLTVTKRQKEILSILYNYIKDTGYPPTFKEMKERLKVSSNQSVIDLLDKLEAKRIITRGESTARSIAILPLGYEVLDKPYLVPFLGVSHAGSPVETSPIQGEWQVMSKEVKKLQSEVFILEISGDSMINAGIEDGDRVLVQSTKEFASGDIVLAQINDESTVKRFISEDKPPYLYLKPENPNHKIVHFTEEVILKGKVISILKGGQWQAIH